MKELFAALQMYIDGHRQKIKDELIYNQGSPDNPDEFSKKSQMLLRKLKNF